MQKHLICLNNQAILILFAISSKRKKMMEKCRFMATLWEM